MKKFLFIILCFAFICACKTSLKEMPTQEVKEEQQQTSVQEFLTEDKIVQPEVKEEKQEIVKDIKPKNTAKQTASKTELKQTTTNT